MTDTDTSTVNTNTKTQAELIIDELEQERPEVIQDILNLYKLLGFTNDISETLQDLPIAALFELRLQALQKYSEVQGYSCSNKIQEALSFFSVKPTVKKRILKKFYKHMLEDNTNEVIQSIVKDQYKVALNWVNTRKVWRKHL